MPRSSPPIATLALCLTVTGCADEIHVYESPVEAAPSRLVGSWEWPVQVSQLDVDTDLTATQTSDFDSEGAAPSSYRMLPLDDSTLVLEGWLAGSPCAPDIACDEGRAYQRHHMTYHVDEDHFFPFALRRRSGVASPVGGAGVFEGFGVEETRLAEPNIDGAAVFRAIETRWRLTLREDGSWSSTTERVDLDREGDPTEADFAEGDWTLDGGSELTLFDVAGQPLHRTLLKQDVIALEGIVFHRRP